MYRPQYNANSIHDLVGKLLFPASERFLTFQFELFECIWVSGYWRQLQAATPLAGCNVQSL